MSNLVQVMLPELILIVAACALFLLGVSSRAASRRLAPWIALAALVANVAILLSGTDAVAVSSLGGDAIRAGVFQHYIQLLTCSIGALLVLLAWPTNADATGSASHDFGTESGEFFALMLLSLSGVLLVAAANDIMLLFLGIELASIPTYIMVSISRPLAVAQEAGVKYFFLGAMSAAVMLFGFSYLYGTTGVTNLSQITDLLRGGGEISVDRVMLTPWQTLAVVMLLAGFAFKIAAVPLHFYAGDVYQGAATPVTAFLAFVPKTSGFVAIIKLLYAIGGGSGWGVPHNIATLLWVLAVVTMTVGNLLALLQYNVKRVLAYSSVAHSGYMLVGLATLAFAHRNLAVQDSALQGVLFYLAAYGVMNTAAFGVLMLLPARTEGDERPRPATSAETYEDLAGQGREHVGLGLAMAVSCFSLTGLPLTVGFFGKLFLIKPALDASSDASIKHMMIWLVVLTMVNAAISAAYYLRIVAAMFLRAGETTADSEVSNGSVDRSSRAPAASVAAASALPVTMAIALSVVATLGLGIVWPATQSLSNLARQSAALEAPAPAPPSAALTMGGAP